MLEKLWSLQGESGKGYSCASKALEETLEALITVYHKIWIITKQSFLNCKVIGAKMCMLRS